MALGAALATSKPQAYAVVPGPGLLNTSAALLTAYSMNAPVLALIGQIPDADIGQGLGHLRDSRPGRHHYARWSMFADRIPRPGRGVRPGRASDAIHAVRAAQVRLHLNAQSTSGDVPVPSPRCPRRPPLTLRSTRTRSQRRQAARHGQATHDRLRRGAQSAAGEITQLSAMLQAPVLGYRRGRGVLDSRDPLSVTLPLGHELWGQADVVLAVGTRLLIQLRQWGIDENLAVIRIDADPKEPARLHKPDVALVGDAQPILRRLVDSIGAYNIHRAARTDEMQERQSAWTKRLRQTRPAARLSCGNPRRAAGGRNFG